jgi:ParB/RepB/Spo0J family partition protein
MSAQPMKKQPPPAEGVAQPLQVPHAALAPDPNQPRQTDAAKGLQHLVDSVRAHGIIQPILVRPHPDPAARAATPYMIVVGERRWTAAGRAGLDEVPVFLLGRPLSPAELLMLQIEENEGENRQELALYDRARAVARAFELDGRSQAQFALHHRRSAAWVSYFLNIARADGPFGEALREGWLHTEFAARTFRRLALEDQQELLDWARKHDIPISLELAEKRAARHERRVRAAAPQTAEAPGIAATPAPPGDAPAPAAARPPRGATRTSAAATTTGPAATRTSAGAAPTPAVEPAAGTSSTTASPAASPSTAGGDDPSAHPHPEPGTPPPPRSLQAAPSATASPAPTPHATGGDDPTAHLHPEPGTPPAPRPAEPIPSLDTPSRSPAPAAAPAAAVLRYRATPQLSSAAPLAPPIDSRSATPPAQAIDARPAATPPSGAAPPDQAPAAGTTPTQLRAPMPAAETRSAAAGLLAAASRGAVAAPSPRIPAAEPDEPPAPPRGAAAVFAVELTLAQLHKLVRLLGQEPAATPRALVDQLLTAL